MTKAMEVAPLPRETDIRLAIVGLGYVGLPLALAFSREVDTLGFDIDAGRAQEIVVMYAGRIVEKAPTRTLFADMKMPYTEALLSAIPKLADPPHTRLAAIGGRPPDLVNPPEGCPFAPRCPYVRERCLTELPALTPVDGDDTHLFACHYPVDSPETIEIKDRLTAQGLLISSPPPGSASDGAQDGR